ncbi:pyruvate kinase [Novosphingobium resinovorum]|uniref:pyruvate kinase n=1 Tax=Novosphingobium resinovorum TaxID=158500 RepID=UPI002ED039D4|nr:pyruvate kinase [Novosphingobium resinovorum]
MPRLEPIFRNRCTKIVATLGPASTDPAVIESLFRAGVDVFRLNFSHGDHADHAARLATLRVLEAKYRRSIGVLADIQGPKLRIGTIRGGYINLERGKALRLDLRDLPGDHERVQLPHREIIEAARPGTRLLLDDGNIRLGVKRVGDGFIDTEVLVGGRLSDRKGVNVPDMVLPIPALTEKDRRDLAFALEHDVDFVGLSFVQTVKDVQEARDLIGDRAWIVSKIEKPQAVADIEAIVEASDGIMVARGDLGVELPPEDVPLVQKDVVALCNRLGRPVIVATQMLESMITAPTPTRAEASDVATAVFDGADAVMLSAETAAGQYPEEAVGIMSRILARVEGSSDWQIRTGERRLPPDRSAGEAIASSARHVADTIEAKAIVAYTQSGATALRIARQRPAVRLLAATPLGKVARRLALVWGVEAVVVEAVERMADAVKEAASICRRLTNAKIEDSFVIVAGTPFGQSGATNALRVSTIRGAQEP